jgi:hypothetical protein
VRTIDIEEDRDADIIIVEPLEDPVPRRAPEREPVRVPEPERVLVPAGE